MRERKTSDCLFGAHILNRQQSFPCMHLENTVLALSEDRAKPTMHNPEETDVNPKKDENMRTFFFFLFFISLCSFTPQTPRVMAVGTRG